MRPLARIKITGQGRGNASCPCETIGELGLPEPGYVPDAWPVRACVRCGAYLVDIHEELVPEAVEGLRRAYPGSTVG